MNFLSDPKLLNITTFLYSKFDMSFTAGPSSQHSASGSSNATSIGAHSASGSSSATSIGAHSASGSSSATSIGAHSASGSSSTSANYASASASTNTTGSKLGVAISDPDWAETHFAIPYKKLEFTTQEDLANGKRLTPSQRKGMVRTVVDSLLLHRKRPLKKISETVAKRMVRKYPSSLRDEVEGDTIGSGYGSLANQLQARWENQNRGHSNATKSSKSTSTTDAAQTKTKKIDRYGCVNYLPSLEQQSIDIETMKNMQDDMKSASEKYGHDQLKDKNIEKQLEQTYYLQRRQINAGDSVPELLNSWPFLFTEVGIGLHFKKLTDIDLKETFLGTLEKKQQKIMSFMKSLSKKSISDIMAEVSTVKLEEKSDECETEGMILAIMAYFGEKPDLLILRTDVSTHFFKN